MKMRYEILETINSPLDLRKLKESDLPKLCKEIRSFIIDTLSGVGGHFSSNLGVVELTVALHYVLETPKDRLIWDVGHQTYPHKILTGRRNKLYTVRKFNGLSGFPKREESDYDLYNTGHAGTSISQLVGESVARDILNLNYHCVAVIGDASIATGMALEAMNHAGHLKNNMLVVLNDNYMSISKNVGSISNYLNNIISSHFYNQWKKLFYTILKWTPIVGPALESFAKKIEKGFKDVLTPGGLFEDLGFSYIGPIDGHDVHRIVYMLKKVKEISGPVLLHVITQKGKGYKPAENDPIKYHGVTPFNKEDGTMDSDKSKTNYSKIVGETLIQLTKRNPRVAVVTPAMIEGSGLTDYAKAFPERIFDVGIAEQHSVAFAGALSAVQIIPYMCIYSTFLSRAMDQLIEDVSLMNLPVRFVIDRAGCVGPDGETHQGLFDLCFLCSLPNMFIILPSSGQDIIDSLKYMEGFQKGPISIRFPKMNVDKKILNFDSEEKIEFGKFRVLDKGKKLLILSLGSMLPIAKQVTEKLEKNNISVTLIDCFWLRPLNHEGLDLEIREVENFIILDESYLDGGASGYILNRINKESLKKYWKTFAFPQEPILHGERDQVMDLYNLSVSKIYTEIELFYKNKS